MLTSKIVGYVIATEYCLQQSSMSLIRSTLARDSRRDKPLHAKRDERMFKGAAIQSRFPLVHTIPLHRLVVN